MNRAVVALLLAAASPVAASAQSGATWEHYAGDLAATRYSALDEIDAQSLPRLEQVWSWSHWDVAKPEQGTAPANFETSPLMIDGLLFVSTPYGNVAALDPVTGKEKWRFDARGDELGIWRSPSGFKHRGVAAWRDGDKLRIFIASRTGLFCLDAQTGELVRSFGVDGRIPISPGAPYDPSGNAAEYLPTSAPVIVGDKIVLGGAISDFYLPESPPAGTVQAFDVRTGKRAWVFSVIPRSADDPAAKTWEGGSWARNGHGNVWPPISADEKRGLVYLPTTTPTNDFYGGNRKGDGLYAESLVCVEAATGRVVWHRQLVHHGLWDYDLPAAPNLMTITVDGRTIDAVAQITKQGFVFTFDRVTGEPVWPIEERAVPTDTDVPGEQPAPTQPFPSLPPPLVPQGLTLQDANDLTPEVKAQSQAVIAKYRQGPLYTPPSMGGTLMRPDAAGAANWGGAAFDPETGVLYVRVSDTPGIATISAITDKAPERQIDYGALGFGRAAIAGGLPVTPPPYAKIVAVDMNRGAIKWSAPLGEGPASLRNHPLLKSVKLPDRLGNPDTRGGALATKTLVFSVGGDGYFYAFDKATGAELWRGKLPYAAGASPVSYRGADGRQYVVVATGSGASAELVAFALEQ